MGVNAKLKRRASRGLLTLAAGLALCLASALPAAADSLTIRFEAPTYHTGTIDGQDGWAGTLGGPINPLIDQEVVANTYGYSSFGGQSWRMSNFYTDGAFGDWPFSPSLHDEAGETTAQNGGLYSGGDRKNHFEVQWDFASTVPNAEQPGLQISTSPDRGDGARMSFIRMKDLPDGLSIIFSDYKDKQPYGSAMNPAAGCGPEDDFRTTTIASGLERNEPHTVKLTMDFVDGPRNDVVRVFVDGALRHVGTSWEDFFRWCEASGQSRTVDSMIFQARTSGGTAPDTLHYGFLFDNLSYRSFMADQCDNHNADGDSDVENGSGGHGHTKFHKHGCSKGSDDSVQHSDSQQGHNFQSTSVDAAVYSTAADGRTVSITGTGTDNGLPVAFTMIAVDHDGALPATYSLVLSDGYIFVGTVTNGLSVL